MNESQASLKAAIELNKENIEIFAYVMGILIVVVPIVMLLLIWRMRGMFERQFDFIKIAPCEVDDRKTVIHGTLHTRSFLRTISIDEGFRGEGQRWRRTSDRQVCNEEEMVWIKKILADQARG